MRIILLGEQARKLETEVDVRLAAFGKLCAGFDTTYGNRSGETGLATDQLAIGKAAEISDLLRRLEDVNGRLSSCISGVSDPRAQMLTRHRGVLQDYSQEYRRLSANLGDARDRTELFGSGTTEVMGLAGQEQAAHDRYERSSIARSNLAVLPRPGCPAHHTRPCPALHALCATNWFCFLRITHGHVCKFCTTIWFAFTYPNASHKTIRAHVCEAHNNGPKKVASNA